MFYENQVENDKERYKSLLTKLGSLSGLFSDNDKPMIFYRAHENCFCKYFEAENLARHDCSADAKKGKIGIGLKTWVGSNVQKVAEFGKIRDELEGLTDEEIVKKISLYRNERIKTTMNMYGIEKMIYHVLVRDTNKMKIAECSFDFIDINNIKYLKSKSGRNTCYFTDKKHVYNFNKSKTTLFMDFDNLTILDEFEVKIENDPFELIEKGIYSLEITKQQKNRKLCLKLFNKRKDGICVVEPRSGLNQWNASGRPRHLNEIYIPFNTKDRHRLENKDFFPDRNTKFELVLPDGKILSAKICQVADRTHPEEGKAIMSNPNKDLGKWLLRDVLNLDEGTLVTYSLLQQKGFDAVIFEKISNTKYKIDFTDSSVYDEMYDEKNPFD